MGLELEIVSLANPLKKQWFFNDFHRFEGAWSVFLGFKLQPKQQSWRIGGSNGWGFGAGSCCMATRYRKKAGWGIPTREGMDEPGPRGRVGKGLF